MTMHKRRPKRNASESAREASRLAFQQELHDRLKDLIDEAPIRTATGLMSLVAALVASSHPGKLSTVERAKVMENGSHVTASRINERSMNRDGVNMALVFSELIGSIALDYSPISNCRALLDDDASVMFQQGTEMTDRVTFAYADNRADGLSAFGTASMMIHAAITEATAESVEPLLLARALYDAIGRLTSQDANGDLSNEPIEETILKDSAGRFGLSEELTRQLLNASLDKNGHGAH